MLIARKIVNPRPFSRKFSEWKDYKYYVPLCRMPTTIVTMDMLDSIEPKDTDKQILRDHKQKVYNKLSRYFGREITKDSPHLIPGYLVRNCIYFGLMCVLIPYTSGASLIMSIFFLCVYLPHSLCIMNQAELYTLYINTIKLLDHPDVLFKKS